jgi:hypothetical protein
LPPDSDAPMPIEIAETVAGDGKTPVEWLGQVPITLDANIPLDHLENLSGAPTSPIEVGTVQRSDGSENADVALAARADGPVSTEPYQVSSPFPPRGYRITLSDKRHYHIYKRPRVAGGLRRDDGTRR